MAQLVFISYSRKDGKYAKALREQLVARGIDTFLDVDSIAPSKSFPQSTAESIAMCKVFLLLWSYNAAESKFITDEWNIAIAQKKVIFPVLLDDCKLPPALSAINALPLIPPAKLANRVVGLLVGDGADQVVSNIISSKRSTSGRILAFTIVMFLLAAMVVVLPGAITRNAAAGPIDKPVDTCLVCPQIGDPETLGPRNPLVPAYLMLEGKVEDLDTGAPIAGVQVTIERYEGCLHSKLGSIREVTDQEGRYAIKIPCKSPRDIRVRFDAMRSGYRSGETTYSPEIGDKFHLFKLEKR